MCLKGRNCSGNCKHQKFKDVYHHIEEKDENGKVIFITNEYKGIEFYCHLYPEKYKKFSEENGPKSSTWVYNNVTMNCYEPNELQHDLDETLNLLNKLIKK